MTQWARKYRHQVSRDMSVKMKYEEQMCTLFFSAVLPLSIQDPESSVKNKGLLGQNSFLKKT